MKNTVKRYLQRRDRVAPHHPHAPRTIREGERHRPDQRARTHLLGALLDAEMDPLTAPLTLPDQPVPALPAAAPLRGQQLRLALARLQLT